jgi:hypothetical protein
MRIAEPLVFPRNNTDKQPPPATALLEERLSSDDGGGTNARALFSVIVQPLTVTLNISKTAIAPPHVEHGSDTSEGQPAKPPTARFLAKVLF